MHVCLISLFGFPHNKGAKIQLSLISPERKYLHYSENMSLKKYYLHTCKESKIKKNPKNAEVKSAAQKKN